MIFLEPKRRYWSKEAAELLTTDGAAMSIRPVVRRPGRDVTLITLRRPRRHRAGDAADAGEDEGWDIEVIDLRSLAPFDDETVAALGAPDRPRRSSSTRRPGSAATAPRWPRESPSSASTTWHAPILRVTGYDIPYPPPKLEEHHLPSVDRILDAVESAAVGRRRA